MQQLFSDSHREKQFFSVLRHSTIQKLNWQLLCFFMFGRGEGGKFFDAYLQKLNLKAGQLKNYTNEVDYRLWTSKHLDEVDMECSK